MEADIGALLEASSLETTARSSSVAEVLAAPLPRGTSVYITALPGIGTNAVVTAAAQLRRAGFNPVPHIGARHIATASELDGLLRRLRGEADIMQVLLIGGDVDRPRGPFASSLDLLDSDALSKHGITRIGLAAYPEPHPRIPAAALEDALAVKIMRAKVAGMSAHIVTQFCFSAEPIIGWIDRFTQRFPDVPIHVGLAGPARIGTLLKYGLTCGIGPSLRSLRRPTALGKLATQTDAGPIVLALLRDGTARRRIAQFHFFTFGGVGRTAEWLRALTAEADLSTARLYE